MTSDDFHHRHLPKPGTGKSKSTGPPPPFSRPSIEIGGRDIKREWLHLADLDVSIGDIIAQVGRVDEIVYEDVPYGVPSGSVVKVQTPSGWHTLPKYVLAFTEVTEDEPPSQ